MVIKVIHNPYSARWTSGKRQADMLNALDTAGLTYELSETEKPGDAINIANQAVEDGFEIIIVAGGDGTIQEVVNGILKKGKNVPLPKLGFMPMGTANDLMANLGMPTDLEKAAKVIAEGYTKQIDLGKVNNRYFINNAGLGLEPFITIIQEKIKYPRGIIRYLLAAVIAILKNPQWAGKIKWDDGEYEGLITMISIGNCARTGGLFYTVPNANPFDGKLSFVYGGIKSRLEIFKALPMAMKPGKGNYIEHPAVNEIHCTWMEASLKPDTPANSDGEMFATEIDQLRYQVHPAALSVIINQ